MANKIDEIDMKIIKLLSQNARMTYKELADKLKTTRQRISRRMNKLEKLGVIQKYTAIPNYEKLGYTYLILGITLRAGSDVDEIIEKLQNIECVKIIQKAIGSHNLVVHIIAPHDMKRIQDIINEISKAIPGIDHMDITFITETTKIEFF
ncbi:Lrp/AsnC family transcriptional regulator [Thermococcus gorgonarius]|uniref:Transcriptional regulator n=1 Tax=Thermococcus gorgonarius TaxID=71997 RepID=A0A2Z2M6K1_THEGO|nr:Lrp/AsnC family transcriptional regulator [Thermococcus gorgonarius]ASJ01256.1 transcriptional regulator [Thermococcus gorgonarius]